MVTKVRRQASGSSEPIDTTLRDNVAYMLSLKWELTATNWRPAQQGDGPLAFIAWQMPYDCHLQIRKAERRSGVVLQIEFVAGIGAECR